MKIDKAQVNGAVYVLCEHETARCSDCKRAVVVKFSKNILGSGGGSVGSSEAEILLEINNSMRGLGGYWKNYKNHVLHYVSHKNVDNETILVSELVQQKRRGYNNLKDFILSGECTITDLNHMIIEIFMTLQIITEIVPGFIHMDLLLSQIFLCESLKPEFLPITSKRIFYLRDKKYSTVLGDFGTSSSKKVINSQLKYHGIEANVFQDIFRFFLNLEELSAGKKIQNYVKTIIDTIFRKLFYVLKSRTRGNGYLPKKVLDEVGPYMYSDVIDALPWLKKYEATLPK